jgi:hypothetical protein
MNLAQEGLSGGFDSMAFIEKIHFFIIKYFLNYGHITCMVLDPSKV